MNERDLDPLVRLPRHDAELGGLDLFSRLDDAPVTIALDNPARVEAVIDRFRDGVLVSLKKPSRVYGWHVQAMFGEVVRALGGPMLMTEDDQGATWCRPTERVKPSDYRIVLPDGSILAVEVKSHHESHPGKPFSVTLRELDGIKRYAVLTGARAMFAIYWTAPGLWLLVDAEWFKASGRRANLDLLASFPENEMALLGDVMIATVPPLELVLDIDEESSEAGPNGTRLAHGRIRQASIAAAGMRVTRKVEQRLAFYMMWNGSWEPSEEDRFADGKIVQRRIRFEPEEWPEEQGFAMLGTYSQLFSRSFLMRTTEAGEIRRVRVELDPRGEGFAIPASYQGHRLPIWRFRLRPRSGRPAGSAADTN